MNSSQEQLSPLGYFFRLAIPVALWAFPAAGYYWHGVTSDFNLASNWTSAQDGTGTHPVGSADKFSGSSLNAAWTFIDKDNDAVTGSQSVSGGELSLSGRGADIWTTKNNFVAVYRNDVTGDFDVSVKVVSQTNTDAWAKAGIMVADTIAALTNGGFCSVFITPGNGVHFAYDISGAVGELESSVTGGTTVYPIWVRLVRSGTSFSAYYKSSLTGSWTQVGTARTPQSTAANSEIALAMTSHNTGSTGTAVFDDFEDGATINSAHALQFSGTGAGADGIARLSASYTAQSIDITDYTGTLDFNGFNLSTSGNFTVTSGAATTFANLGGRTLSIGGNASLNGTSGNLLNMNPGSGWTIAVTGTLSATYAGISNSNASVSSGTAGNSTDGGGNTNWTFASNNCTNTFSASSSPTSEVNEGDSLQLTGSSGCALRVNWSVVSGPNVELADPASAVQRLLSPRVSSDTTVVFRFSALTGETWSSLDVAVRILNSTPDPVFSLPAPPASQPAWNGVDSLVLAPLISNWAEMRASGDSVLAYAWSYVGVPVDTASGSGKLVLRAPKGNGKITVTLCLSNGGETVCAESEITVNKATVSLSSLWAGGGKSKMEWRGNELFWNADARIRIWSLEGRTLFDKRAPKGTRVALPPGLHGRLRRGDSFLILLK